jgi:hypothetical protein
VTRLVVSIGASKAGTTTLFDLMRQHPAVDVTTVKETNFFFDDAQYAKGYPWFLETYFPHSAGKQLLFEADNAYMCSRRSLERIKACDPRTRILIMLRNPAERAFSQWLYHMQMGRSAESFAEAIAMEPGRIADGDAAVNRWGYLERGRYGKYITQVLELFPREQTYCIVFERFVRDQAGEFARLASWLDLPTAAIVPSYENPTGRPRSTMIARVLYDENLRGLRRTLAKPFGTGVVKQWVLGSINRLNVVPYGRHDKPRLDPGLRQQILQDLEPDIALTERLTGLDLSIWRARGAAAA